MSTGGFPPSAPAQPRQRAGERGPGAASVATSPPLAVAAGTDVVLVDAGGTNIGSVRYALQRLGVRATQADDPDRIRQATHVILPGVGAAGPGMQRLHRRGHDDLLRSLTQPVLGVCLGMQLLFEHSEEGDTACLGIIPGSVRKLHAGEGQPPHPEVQASSPYAGARHEPRSIRIPHMGWNSLQVERDSPLLAGIHTGAARAYFVHSYAAPVGPCTLASSTHGQVFSAIVRHRNFVGMQFHPERSAALGAQLLANFLKWQGCVR